MDEIPWKYADHPTAAAIVASQLLAEGQDDGIRKQTLIEAASCHLKAT